MIDPCIYVCLCVGLYIIINTNLMTINVTTSTSTTTIIQNQLLSVFSLIVCLALSIKNKYEQNDWI